MSLSLWGNFEGFANVDPFSDEILFEGDRDSRFHGYTYTRKSVNHIVYEGGVVDLSLEDDENLQLSLYGMASEELITKVKIEVGTKATDWTPAPEDQVSDWNETDVNSFAFLKNKPTTFATLGLTDNAGSATQPVYFSGGKPVAATTYANASVKYATSAGTATDATKLPLSGGTVTGKIISNGTKRSAGMYGTYDSAKIAHI